MRSRPKIKPHLSLRSDSFCHSVISCSAYLLIYSVTALAGVLCGYTFKKKETIKKTSCWILVTDCLEYLATYVRDGVQQFEHRRWVLKVLWKISTTLFPLSEILITRSWKWGVLSKRVFLVTESWPGCKFKIKNVSRIYNSFRVSLKKCMFCCHLCDTQTKILYQSYSLCSFSYYIAIRFWVPEVLNNWGLYFQLSLIKLEFVLLMVLSNSELE